MKGPHGLPEDSMQKKGPSEEDVDEEFGGFGADKASTYRPKDETVEEKLERKKAVKQERRVGTRLDRWFITVL